MCLCVFVQVVGLTGATGAWKGKISGLYELTGEQINARPLFRKLGDEAVTLRYDADGRWSVCEGSAVRAISKQTGLALPQECAAWALPAWGGDMATLQVSQVLRGARRWRCSGRLIVARLQLGSARGAAHV